MSRRRWVKVTWPIRMRELVKRMHQQPFSGDAKSGFVIERARDTFVEARFVERFDFSEPFIDPIGRELRSDRIEFYQTQFVASESDLGLEIIDSSKGTRSFINRISAICDDKLALSGLSIDPVVWGHELQKRVGTEFIAESMQITGLMVSPAVMAKIVLTGSVDVQKPASDLTHGKACRVEKLRLSTAEKPKLSVLLATNGTAATFGKGEEGLVVSVRDALASIISRPSQSRARG